MPRKPLIAGHPIGLALESYYKAERDLAAAWKEVDKLWSDKTANNLRKGATIEDYKKALRMVDARQIAVFGMLDRWRFLVRHKDDPILVPEADIRAIVIDSLSDKFEELQLSSNVGWIGTKIAQAIRQDVSEGSSGRPAFCNDCA